MIPNKIQKSFITAISDMDRGSNIYKTNKNITVYLIHLINTLVVFFSSILVQRADVWLQHNPQNDLINCETVDKKVLLTKDVYNSSMVFIDEETPTLATHIKGLR